MNEWKATLNKVVDGGFWFINKDVRIASLTALRAIEVLEGQTIEARNCAKHYKDDFVNVSNKRLEAEQELVATRQSLVNKEEEKRELTASTERANSEVRQKSAQMQEQWKLVQKQDGQIKDLLTEIEDTTQDLVKYRQMSQQLTERLNENCEAIIELQDQRDAYGNELMEYLASIRIFQNDIEELRKKFPAETESQPCE